MSHHPPQVSGLTLAHPCSPTFTNPHQPSPTAVRSTNQLRGSISRPLASESKMGSHDSVVSALHRTRRQVDAKYDSELAFSPFSLLIFSFCNLSRCPLSIAVVYPPNLCFVVALHSHSCCTLSLSFFLPLHSPFPSPSSDGPKTYHEKLPANSGGERLDTGGL